MKDNREKFRMVRLLCVALVAAVLVLSLLLLVAVCSDASLGGVSVDTTKNGFWDILPDGPIHPDGLPETIVIIPDSSDDTTGELLPEPGSGDPGDDPFDPWGGGLEWPTLPPSDDTEPEQEWPTIPEEWETLPEEWETLPEDWDAEYPDVGDIADALVGMGGSLNKPQGALGDGIASNLIMMKILAERDDLLYLKMQSFGSFDGREWRAAGGYPYLYLDQYSALYLPHLTMNRVDQERGFSLEIDPVADARVIPYYLTSSHAGSEYQNQDTMATGSTEIPYVLFYRHYAEHSIGEAEEPDSYGFMEKNKLYAFEKSYQAYVYRNYTQIDSMTEAYMNLIIEKQGFDRNDPDIIEKVAVYIQNAAVYNLNYNPNLDRESNVALAFLGGYKEGVCRHFATAATLLYRALGIPARYTVGFQVDVKGGETTNVLGEDAHAWVEVYEDGFGWRYVEVTGSGSQGGSDQPGGSDTAPGSGGNPEPPAEPATWGDIIAGCGGQIAISNSIPSAMLNSTIFHISAEESLRHFLKLKSFGDYTGQGWANAEDYPWKDMSAYSPSYFGGAVIGAAGESLLHMTIESPMGTVGVPYYVSPATVGEHILIGDNRMSGNGKIPYDIFYYPYADVTAADVLSPEDRVALETYLEMFGDYVRKNYTEVDDETYIAAIVRDQGWSPDDPRVAEKIVAYLKSVAVYREDYDRNLDKEPNVAVAFLQSYGEGSSRHFASAATLLFRAVGIPARYTVGYVADTVAGETVNVKGTDAYAWVEIYRDGFGWTAVDVTPAGDYRPTVKLRPVTVIQKFELHVVHAVNELTGFEEYEKLGYTYQAVVQGSRYEPGVSTSVIASVEIFDPHGNNVTDEFRIELQQGAIFLYTSAFTFGANDYSKVYDGTPVMLTEGDVLLIDADTQDGKLPENRYYLIVPSGGVRDVGSGILPFDVRIMQWDPNGDVDVTEFYYIRKIYARYTISPREITLKAADARKVYDGTPLTANEIEIAGGSLAEGDYIAEYTVDGSITRVGRADNVITGVVIRNADGEDVTHNYAIETLVGTLRVTNS